MDGFTALEDHICPDVTHQYALETAMSTLNATLPSRTSTPEAWGHSEGKLARTIEEQTAKLPSDTFLWAGVGAMAAALALQISGKKPASLFIGQWVAPFLLFGVYNKIVKVAGTDRIHG